MNKGKGVSQSTIQCIGTPCSQYLEDSSARVLDFGLRWRKRAFSRVSIASTEASVIREGMISLATIDLGQLPSRVRGADTTPMDFCVIILFEIPPPPKSTLFPYTSLIPGQ